ncbi:hypothetical protein [Thiopseudomonas alkaliphila]|nr:hypothetical protein [Thiopseudomonas alkaliphila]MDM1708362.1 hypothetical protein [Thiopseudomonas alkaliphila]
MTQLYTLGMHNSAAPEQRTIHYIAPFFKPNREQDYATAWAFFEGNP